MFWLYHLPNIVLAAMMYTLAGRYIFSLFFPPNSDKVIWRVFCQITDPILKVVSYITPRIVPDRVLILLAIVWLLLLRMGLFLALRMAGYDIGTEG